MPTERSKLSHPNVDKSALRRDRSFLLFQTADQIRNCGFYWPIHGVIAYGTMAVVAGDRWSGKSTPGASLAAIATSTGRFSPEETPNVEGRTIILSTEHKPAETIISRLKAVALDKCLLEKRYRPKGSGLRSVRLVNDIDNTAGLLARLPNARLVTVDPLSRYVMSADVYPDSQVRAALSPILSVALRHGIAVVTICRLTKASATSALSGTLRSSSIFAASRTSYLITRDAECDRHLVLPFESNLSGDRDGFAFRIASATLKGGMATTCIRWDRKLISMTAEEALRLLKTRVA